MGKGLKWILIIGGGLTIFVIAALIIIPFFVDINKFKPEIEKWVAEATGRSFTIGSDLDLSLFPFAGIKFSNLQLGSPQGFKEKEFVTIKEFEVRVKLLPLISKEVQVKRFIMNQPRIVLVKNKTGKTNWDFGKKQVDKAKPEPKSTPSEPAAGGIPIKKLDGDSTGSRWNPHQEAGCSGVRHNKRHTRLHRPRSRAEKGNFRFYPQTG